MKNVYLLISLFLVLSMASYGQKVISGEYFIDIDSGLGKGHPINFVAKNAVSVTFPVNATGLTLGYHNLYFRVKDSNGNWGNYRTQRFYVYDNNPINSKGDSVVLVQAEYFIDTPPIPGKGKLISLTASDTINYSAPIPELQLDSGLHFIGVRVKDNKGNWSFIKTDSVRTEYSNIEISVESPPFVAPGDKEKYSITIKNNGSQNVYDLFLIIHPSKQTSPTFTVLPDSIGGISISTINPITEFNSQQYIPIWIYSIPSRKEVSFDLYMVTSNDALPHEILNQSFEIWANVISDENTFLNTGDLSLISNSKLCSILRESYYELIDSLQLPSITDSILLSNLTSWFNAYPEIKDPLFFNLLGAPVYKYLFGIELSDSEASVVNQTCFDLLRDKYFDTDNDTLGFKIIMRSEENDPCSPPQCNGVSPCQTPQPPLAPEYMFDISDQPCVIRCYCNCINDTMNNVNKPHGAWDLSMLPAYRNTGNDVEIVNGKSQSKWDHSDYIATALYGGTVETGYQANSKGKGWGKFVKITSCTGTNQFSTIYAHLGDFLVASGAKVAAGAPIGKVSNTGTGKKPGVNDIHLHIEFQENNTKQDPRCYFDAHEFYINKTDVPDDQPCKQKGPLCVMNTALTCDSKKAKSCAPPPSAQTCPNPQNRVPGDPNDKIGDEGTGLKHYIQFSDELHYGIFFQNVDTASAPAQMVKIVDTIDVSKVDASSLRIESIIAGEMLFVLPDTSHIQNLDTIYKKEPINGTYVHLQTAFDTLTGVLQFILTSLDTTSLLPVTDPLQGFLPPDTSHFNGHGLVSYKAFPKTTIPDESVIYNTAHIVFDANPPIATGTWFNTIDRAAPVSRVNPLPATTFDSSFLVSWTGTDHGSGVAYFDIYEKTSGDSIFTKWLSKSISHSAVFTGKWDSTYQFYSIAYDSVGNVENKSPLVEANTTLMNATGISFVLNSSIIKIYPNPTSRKLNIDIQSSSTSKNLSISIFNLTGQMLMSKKYSVSKTSIKDQFDLSSYSSGVYLVEIQTDNGKILRKFVKN